jgi:hypothetical protein
MAVNLGINIQRSPNRINQQLREAGVGGKYPKLLLDFADNYYLASGGSKTLANAVTHARAGNATMTDGYGPELVTNGGFDSDSDWTLGTGWSIADGKAQSSAITYQTISQSLSNTAGIYEVRVQASGNTNSDGTLVVDLDGDQYLTGYGDDANGTFVAYLEATADSTIAFGASTRATARFNGSIDNVSVREMPVIKWAPHNLSPYSEQFDQWTQDDVTVSSNSITAPDGTTTADKIVEDSDNSNHFVSKNVGTVVAGSIYTSSVFAKAGEVSILQASHSFLANTYANFDLSSGTVTAKSSSVTATITDVGDGWYLCEAQSPYTSGGTAVNAWMLQESGTAARGAAYQGDGSSGLYLWGAHFYRSDLGGMGDNPERGDSYVPTTSSAKYLPRIGHHVYNGSAWVNEGVLAESESRTNALTYSNELTNAAWIKNVTVTEVDDKYGFTLFELSQTGTGSFTNISQNGPTVADDGYVTLSAYVKAGASPQTAIRIQETANTQRCTQPINWSNGVPSFDTVNFTTDLQLQERSIQDVGDGLYRVAIVAQNTTGSSIGTTCFYYNQWNGSSDSPDSYVGAMQAELGSTPSSYIPTSGSSVTRAAETFTIPSANLPWPTPQYIGSELVTNGTFDTDSDWIEHATWNISGGVATHSATNGGGLSQAWTPTAGSVYEITFTITGATSGNAYYAFSSASGLVANQIIGTIRTTNGTYKEYIVADATTVYHGVWGTSTFDGSVDNISVREINPLAVSIGMEGRMTYADIDAFDKPKMFRWYDSATDRIFHSLDTNNGTGEPKFVQEANNIFDAVQGNGSEYAPDVFVPFNMAARHGSTFINGAVDGVALTADTTPTALPDLSSTDLDLAYEYMGTLSSFRVWDRDITDAGLVEATEPSLEPSLSLTFEGVGTNSFVVNDWSE